MPPKHTVDDAGMKLLLDSLKLHMPADKDPCAESLVIACSSSIA